MTAGGIIPDDDVPALKAAGVSAVFGPGTTIGEVADFLRANVRPREGRRRSQPAPRPSHGTAGQRPGAAELAAATAAGDRRPWPAC